MPEFNKIDIKLKNNKIVTIRRGEVSDAQDLLDLIKAYIPQSKYIPKLEKEIKLTLEQEEKWIDAFLKSKNSILLVAEYENRLIGNIDLTGNPRAIMKHTAVIGMGMPKEWRNSGLGTALLKEVIGWARQNPILELIWLQVYTENVLGVNLYKKMGFKENGILEGFFKRDNVYFDQLTMSMIVK